MRKATLTIGLLLVASLAIAAVIGGCSAATRPAGYAMTGEVRVSQPSSVAGSFQQSVSERSRPGTSTGEELWIIEKPQPGANPPADGSVPGCGALVARLGNKNVPFPLKRTDVRASVAGYIASVDVTQRYQNPYDTKIEAVYVFPLPHNAAVSEFVMTIGQRRIRGIIRERKEAEQIYREARDQGYIASLMTQQRPNIFTQSVANIEPGKEIEVSIRYYNTLAYVDGWSEFVFPMVVGPRFNPPGTSDGIGAVGRGAAGVSAHPTQVQYLHPGERSGHDISLSLDIDAGVRIENLKSINHAIITGATEGPRVSLALAPSDSIPNKDFVLRWEVAGKTIKSALFTHKDQRGGYFTLMLVPPQSLQELPRKPLEMVFTLDVSGSMDGRPLEQAKDAIRWALSHMNAKDTFEVIRFGDHADRLFSSAVPTTGENIQRALRWIDQTQAGGGTMLVDGLRASLRFPHDESRTRVIAFLTDGFIGNEAEALREIHQSLGPARIFSFGVGSSTNRYLMEAMAKMGSGAAAFLSLNERGQDVMEPFFNHVSHPAMTDLSIDFGGMNVREVYPPRLPDLMVGRPVMITGRFDGAGSPVVKVRGRVAGEWREISIPVELDGETLAGAGVAIPQIWARAKMGEIMERALWEGGGEWTGSIRSLALEYGLLSPYTAFLAVDATAATAGDHGMIVPVAVPVPEGTRYETTVQRRE